MSELISDADLTLHDSLDRSLNVLFRYALGYNMLSIPKPWSTIRAKARCTPVELQAIAMQSQKTFSRSRKPVTSIGSSIHPDAYIKTNTMSIAY